ncbi:MAG: VCBS repeat-containing protein, partial [Candidatus Sumerlaeota bacterium]|nr:VCBS repeat-containing protein [Candidatus Sumerlaeota bacterium]
ARLLRLNAGWAGKSGRRKFLLTDWDRDGRIDILANSLNMNFLKNVGEGGRFVFRDMGPMVPERLAGHDTCPAVVDWNGDGASELIIGAEDGYFYYYPDLGSNR